MLETGGLGHLGKFGTTVIEEQPGSACDSIDDEIEVIIAVDVGECSARGSLIGTGNAGCVCDRLESPIAEVAIEFITIVQAAEVKVAPAISINITGGDAGTAVICSSRMPPPTGDSPHHKSLMDSLSPTSITTATSIW